jgi:predicted ribosome quality control (RQC) complex YloA/Tae2 family protein
MHNNYHFLKHLATELKTKLSGMELHACFSQEKDELMLAFTKNETEVFLKCTLKPEFSCITVQNEFARARKNTVNLWEEIYGLAVINCLVFENERALKIELQNNYLLIIKLFGNRPNLLVYKNNEQIAIFNNSLISDKNLKLSDFKKDADFSLAYFKSLNGDYKKVFFTFGKNVFSYLNPKLENLNMDEKWNYIQDFIKELDNPSYNVGIFNELPALCLFPIEEPKYQFNTGIEAINAFYLFYQKEYTFSNQKNAFLNTLTKEKQKTESYLKNTEAKLNTLKSGQSKEIIANILMANLHIIEDGLTEIELMNFYTDEPITIKLKKELSPQKNAENYYRKSKNEKIEVESIEKNIALAFNKIVEIEGQIADIESTEHFKELKNTLKSQKKTESEKESPKSLFKEFMKEGHLILVGKNAKNNDTLTLKHAQKEDYWLHARDCSGSHVVIKRKNKENLPNHIIEYAASLAAFYSKRKNESVVPVIFTQKKFVRKTKGLADGKVIVDKESTIMIEPFDPEK